jgi:hypothetical protein
MRSLLKSSWNPHLFNDAKGHDAAWVDPNEELMPK